MTICTLPTTNPHLTYYRWCTVSTFPTTDDTDGTDWAAHGLCYDTDGKGLLWFWLRQAFSATEWTRRDAEGRLVQVVVKYIVVVVIVQLGASLRPRVPVAPGLGAKCSRPWSKTLHALEQNAPCYGASSPSRRMWWLACSLTILVDYFQSYSR